jgi:hypothetical protein
MLFEELMSALEDLGASTFKMPRVATYNTTATPVRSSLAAAIEQELEQPKDIVVNYCHNRLSSGRTLRSLFVRPMESTLNILHSQQSQQHPMLKNLMFVSAASSRSHPETLLCPSTTWH